MTFTAYTVNLTTKYGHTCVFAHQPGGHYECPDGFPVLRADVPAARERYNATQTTLVGAGEHR